MSAPRGKRAAGWSVTLTQGQAATVAQALADAEAYRRPQAEDWCADCEAVPQSACEDHLNDLDQADAYRDLAAELARALPGEENSS